MALYSLTRIPMYFLSFSPPTGAGEYNEGQLSIGVGLMNITLKEWDLNASFVTFENGGIMSPNNMVGWMEKK